MCRDDVSAGQTSLASSVQHTAKTRLRICPRTGSIGAAEWVRVEDRPYYSRRIWSRHYRRGTVHGRLLVRECPGIIAAKLRDHGGSGSFGTLRRADSAIVSPIVVTLVIN